MKKSKIKINVEPLFVYSAQKNPKSEMDTDPTTTVIILTKTGVYQK